MDRRIRIKTAIVNLDGEFARLDRERIDPETPWDRICEIDERQDEINDEVETLRGML